MAVGVGGEDLDGAVGPLFRAADDRDVPPPQVLGRRLRVFHLEGEVMRAAQAQQVPRDVDSGRPRLGVFEDQVDLRLAGLEPAPSKENPGRSIGCIPSTPT